MTKPQKEPVHFGYIDVIRGLAFMAVLAIHVAISLGPFPLKFFFSKGDCGVQLFFLASAVTLCMSMASRQKVDKFPVAFFYIRRFFRIAPLFWLAMAFYWVFPGVMPAHWMGEWAPHGVDASYFILAGLFLHGWHPYAFNSIVPGGWSIAVEMNFYLFFPLIFSILATSWRRTVVAVLCSVIYLRLLIHFDSWIRQHFFPDHIPDYVWSFFSSAWFPTQLPVFLAGFLVYHLLRNEVVRALVKDRFVSTSLLCFAAMLLLSLFKQGASGFIPLSFLVVLVLGLVIIAISGDVLPAVLSRVISYIGRVSYSCYLVHFAVLGTTLKYLGINLTVDHLFYDAGSSGANLRLFVLIYAITLALTTLVATVTLHLVENPGIALGRMIISKINESAVKK